MLQLEELIFHYFGLRIMQSTTLIPNDPLVKTIRKNIVHL